MITEGAKNDARQIRQIIEAKKDSGIEDILRILRDRPNSTRQAIKRAYRTMFKEELVDSTNKTFKGHENILTALTSLPEDYDAKELYNSMKGLGTREETLSELLATRTNDEIRAAGYAYRHWYGQNLKDDVAADTSGDYRTMCLALCDAKRKEDNHVDPQRAQYTAQKLTEKKKDTDETFISVLTTESFPQILEIGRQYQAMTGKDFEQALIKEFGADPEFLALAIYKTALDKPGFFAELIHNSVKKGSIDTALRIACGREDKDLSAINDSFEARYQTPVNRFIEDHVKDKKSTLARDTTMALVFKAH